MRYLDPDTIKLKAVAVDNFDSTRVGTIITLYVVNKAPVVKFVNPAAATTIKPLIHFDMTLPPGDAVGVRDCSAFFARAGRGKSPPHRLQRYRRPYQSLPP